MIFLIQASRFEGIALQNFFLEQTPYPTLQE
jgi:hypothetical protein